MTPVLGRLAAIVAVSLTTCFASAQLTLPKLDDPGTAKQKYETFKTRVMHGDLTLDWKAFRVAAAVARTRSDFNPTATAQSSAEAFAAGKYGLSLQLAQALIDHNMVDPWGHVFAYQALDKLSKAKEAQRELAIAQAIIASISNSGDGKTPATAWFAVDVIEERFYITAILRANSKSHRAEQRDGHWLDNIVVTDEEGNDQQIWFNIDTDMQIMLSTAPKE